MFRFTGLALTLAAAGVLAAQSSGGQSPTSQSGSSSGQTSSSSQSSSGTSGQTDQSSSSSQSSSGMSGQSGQSSTSSQSAETMPGQSAGESASQLSSKERKFLIKAAQGSMAEIQIGKLAQERGSSEQVKQLGEKLVEDHTKALEQARQVAQNKGVDLPQDLAKKEQSTHDRLSRLSGDEFDRAFLKESRRDHSKNIKEFERQSNNAKDTDVKQFASQTLPVLQQHHQMTEQAMAAIQPSGDRSGIRTDNDTGSGATSGSSGSMSGSSDRDRDRSGTSSGSSDSMSGSGSSSGTSGSGSTYGSGSSSGTMGSGSSSSGTGNSGTKKQ